MIAHLEATTKSALILFRGIGRDPLTSLANRYGSDKGDTVHGAHCYAGIYHRLFSHRRAEPLTLLEIGLLHPFDDGKTATRAPSLMMWRKYFKNASLFGFDINDFTKVHIRDCVIGRGDVGKKEDLLTFGKLFGPFDIVIDDASHASNHQQISLGTLFPFIKTDGLYIIEDLHWQPKELEQPSIPTTRKLIRNFLVTSKFKSPVLSEAEQSYLDHHIHSIQLFDSKDRLCADKKDALAIISKR